MDEHNKTRIIDMLENYVQNIRKIALLRYELGHPALVSPSEMIEAMSFAKGTGEGGHPNGCVSDKTYYTAIDYQEAAAQLNTEASQEIMKKLVPLEQETDRLKHYVALLEARQSLVIRKHYFEVCSWDEVSAELNLTIRALYKVRDKAIAALVEMYKFTGILS